MKSEVAAGGVTMDFKLQYRRLHAHPSLHGKGEGGALSIIRDDQVQFRARHLDLHLLLQEGPLAGQAHRRSGVHHAEAVRVHPMPGAVARPPTVLRVHVMCTCASTAWTSRHVAPAGRRGGAPPAAEGVAAEVPPKPPVMSVSP